MNGGAKRVVRGVLALGAASLGMSGVAWAQQGYNSQRVQFERMLSGWDGQSPSGQMVVPRAPLPQVPQYQPPPYNPEVAPVGPESEIGEPLPLLPPPESTLSGEVPGVPESAITQPVSPLTTAPFAASDIGGLAELGGTSAPSTGLGGTIGGGGFGTPGMLGDYLALRRYRVMVRPSQVPGEADGGQPFPPSPGAKSLFAPSVRNFKIAENMSAVPQDRLFFSFNYFNDVNSRLNDAFDSPVVDLMAYRYVFGFEKMFNEGQGSFGLRLPLNSIYAANRDPSLNVGGNSTALGNLTFFTKYILEQNPRTGSLLSVGLAISPETGPASFADAPFLQGLNATYVQPFLGYIINLNDRLYVQGFSSIEVPSTDRDAVMVYNDIGMGYFLYRAQYVDQLITALVPTFEAHINTPLTHRDEYDELDPAGTPDVVNLTTGFHTEFFGTAIATFGVVTPVTGPRPFDFEVIGLLNFYFGGSRRRPGQAVTGIGFPLTGG